MWELSKPYTTKASVLFTDAVNWYFHLYRCGYHFNRIDEVTLAAGTLDAEDDSLASNLEYNH